MVHDVAELRGPKTDAYHKREFKRMMEIADVLIVHNDVMRDFFIKKGFDENRIVTLGIFDYLQEKRDRALPTFDESVIIAGNLNLKKSGYLKNLPELKSKFRLYGPNYSMAEAPNITYGGVLSPEHIPDVLTSGFGLIWDGDSIETCEGGTGEYLRYNNPHKLSLYLSSGLPVIIWKEAAEAGFVEENHVGYTIDSLYDIPKIMNTISAEEYRNIAENVKRIAGKMADGGFMRDALETAVGLIEI